MTQKHFNEWKSRAFLPSTDETTGSDLFSLELPSPLQEQNHSIPVLESPPTGQMGNVGRLPDTDRSSLLSFLTATNA